MLGVPPIWATRCPSRRHGVRTNRTLHYRQVWQSSDPLRAFTILYVNGYAGYVWVREIYPHAGQLHTIPITDFWTLDYTRV